MKQHGIKFPTKCQQFKIQCSAIVADFLKAMVLSFRVIINLTGRRSGVNEREERGRLQGRSRKFKNGRRLDERVGEMNDRLEED